MHQINGKKICDFIINWGIISIFFFIPLVFFLFTYGNWQIAKLTVFQTLTEIIFFTWLIKILIFEKLKITKTEFYKIIPAFIFIFILGIATIFSTSFHYSFFGSYTRKMGYITWLHFFLFFLVFYFWLDQKKIKKIIQAILFSSIFVFIYGFLQIIGLDPVNWSEPAIVYGRVFSTFGQPNFFASWILLILPVAIYSFFFYKKFLIKILIAILIAALFFLLIFTQSRGAWISLFFSIFFFIFVYVLFFKKRKLFFYSIILLIAIFGFSIYLHFYPPKVNNPLLKRIISLTQIKGSAKLRLIWWKNSLDLIKKSPILGYGPERQAFYFVRYYQPEDAIYERINSYPDRAHNDILDTLLTSGFLGLASYLFLIGSTFYYGLKKIKLNYLTKQPDNYVILSFLTGLFAYLVSIQFSFQVIATAVYFWGFLAIILKISNKNYA